MRLEVEREVGTAESAAEGSVAPEARQKAAEHLREIEVEMQRWIAKREEALARKEKLLKLLQLYGPKESNKEQIEPINDSKLADMGEDKAGKVATSALARKKELKELHARAEAAREKQQAAATVLARSLKQLQAKRKREENEAGKQPRKKPDVGCKGAVGTAVAEPVMHPFAAAPKLDVDTPELAKAACFRIAARHLAQTGTIISRAKLEQVFKTYTGNVLGEVVDWSLVEHTLASLTVDGSVRTTHPSNSTGGRSVCWQPGRQFLKTPSFLSSDAGRIQSLIALEKDVIVSVCDSLRVPDSPDGKVTTFVRRRRQKYFLANLLADSDVTPTLSTLLCAFIGVKTAKVATSNNLRISYRSHGQMAGVLDKLEIWLREQAEMSEPYSSLAPRFDGQDGARVVREHFFSSKYAKPFSIANDSVIRQLKGGALRTPGLKKFDPMKVLCHYELNGVCNDKNCSNYHQKDYEPVAEERINGSDCTGEDDDSARVGVVTVDDMDKLLASFAEFRARITTKWPVITTSQFSSVTGKESNDGESIATNAPSYERNDAAVSVALDTEGKERESVEDGGDFIVLDRRKEIPETGDARYFDGSDSWKVYGEMLQTKVKRNPCDTDAWLLLAIYQLDLEVGLSDEAASLSDDDRLEQQLLFLCKEINLKQRSGTLAVVEANLKRCLHTLSRALEVEANAYCEALWLLYLHLCRQVTNRQTEIDMAEQAVQFLPNSHALWLHYISIYEFESVGMAEGIYWRLLEHIARTNLDQEESKHSKPTTTKELSILLASICFHLCIKLWRAGATTRVLEILSAVLQLDDVSSELASCSMVCGRLRSDERIVFCLVFAHVLLFMEPPELIEHWVAASCHERIPIKGLAYTAESLRDGCCEIEGNSFAQALASYELAFHIFNRECDAMHDAGDVILSNWMLLLALRGDRSKNGEPLTAFVREKYDMIQQFPGASLTAAKLMGLTSTGDQQARHLMLRMMNQSSDTQFPEALHHYLFACRQSPALVNALDKTFPDVMERVASLLDVDIDLVEKSIQNIMHDTSNISKSRALKTLLEALLGAWMNQLSLLRRGPPQHQSTDKQTRLLADIYVALDICHLMGVLLEPSVAIDGIQTVLSSSSFGTLPLEARQLAWMQRVIFQVDLVQQGGSDSVLWREHQAVLTQLFRKYMIEMSVEAEMMRQVSRQIKHDIAKSAVEDAVCDCLNPERSQLITYDVNVELFRLCSAAVAGPEKAAFYASYSDVLALSSEFSLAFSDVATHEWELLAARASLKKCLAGAKTHHSQILRALVGVELRLRNMKAISGLLEAEMQANPLLLECWRLAVGLEILFGEKVDERSKMISEDMEKRQLILACNTFGDDKMLDQKGIPWSKFLETVLLNLRGFGLEYLPNAVLLHNKLVSLNVSGNELVELPMGLRQLNHLQELDASENALLEVPSSINSLTKLKELRLAHNNLTTISMLALPCLVVMDIRWNAITRLPVSALVTLTKLKTLQAEDNTISVDELSKISNLLSGRENVVSPDLETQTAGRKSDQQPEENEDETATKQRNNAMLTEIKRLEVKHTMGDTNSANVENSSMAAENVTIARAAKKDNGDRIMEEECARKPKEDEEEETMIVEKVDSRLPLEKNGDDQIMVEENPEVSSMLTEKDGDQIIIQEPLGKTDDSSSAVSTLVNKAVVQSKEVIEIDCSELPEENEKEAPAPEDDHRTLSGNLTEDTAGTTKTADVLPISDGIAEAEDFAQQHSDAVTATVARRQSCHDAATTARRKLATYMEQNHIDNRAEVRRQNPTLWREFLAASLPVNLELPACRLCFAPNDGHNQRLNSTVLCARCLEEALVVLKDRNDESEVAEEIV